MVPHKVLENGDTVQLNMDPVVPVHTQWLVGSERQEPSESVYILAGSENAADDSHRVTSSAGQVL